MAAFTTKLDDELLRRLELRARATPQTRSQVVSDLLAKGLAEEQPPNLFERAGDLIGSLHGAPADLASNPAYLDDFGR